MLCTWVIHYTNSNVIQNRSCPRQKTMKQTTRNPSPSLLCFYSLTPLSARVRSLFGSSPFCSYPSFLLLLSFSFCSSFLSLRVHLLVCVHLNEWFNSRHTRLNVTFLSFPFIFLYFFEFYLLFLFFSLFFSSFFHLHVFSYFVHLLLYLNFNFLRIFIMLKYILQYETK